MLSLNPQEPATIAADGNKSRFSCSQLAKNRQTLSERICTASRGMVTAAGTSESGCTPARDPLQMPLCSRMAVFIVRFPNPQTTPRPWLKLSLHFAQPRINERFYEKVIKVKADVAALLIISFSDIAATSKWCGELSRAPFFLALILTLDSFPLHFIIERGTKRNAVQWSFVP